MKKKKIILWVLAMLVLVFGATTGYMLILGIDFIDALYMTVITISTVGYREVVDLNHAAKLFTIVLIITSVGMIGYLLAQLFKFFSEGHINEAWRKKKMQKEIENLNKHIIICGAGDTGGHVIKQMIRRDIPFIVIENDDQQIEQLKELNALYIEGDATKEETLTLAGVDKAKGLISCLSKDADNVFVVLTARGLNKQLKIIARYHDKNSDKKLRRAGANHVVSPDEIGGKKMASIMINPQAQFFVDNIIDTKNLSFNMEEIMINNESELIGKQLREAKISEKAGLVVLAIRRANDQFIFNPKANETLAVEDKMIVVGSKKQIAILRTMANELEL
eukprot:Anaeramoba_ignava/a6060_11.p1 GENE.a6060_11~~a6060_11.p1  ORF type:complete len:335 (-),score=26.89 a6060_11:67-1071(-)